MAGSRGPLGKPDGEHMGHRTKAQAAAITKLAPKRVTWTAADPDWEEPARLMYESLKKSPQGELLQQSDAATAYFLACVTSKFIERGMTNGQMFSSIMSGWDALLATESARRRLRIEIQKEAVDIEASDPVAELMKAYAAQLQAPPAATAA